MDHLPIKGCLRIKDGQQTQSCPEAVFKGTEQTKIGRFEAFGCPAVAKVFQRKTVPRSAEEKRTVSDSRNIIQRGVRGVFVGLPTNQAGWLVCVPQSDKVFTSADVAFDENFETFGLACNKLLCHDSLPVQGKGHSCIDNSRLQAFAGPPQVLHFEPDDEDMEPPVPQINEDEIEFIDQFELVPASAIQDELDSNGQEVQEEPRTFDPDETFNFIDLLNHQGPLKRGDPDCQGSMCDVEVLWEDGSTSWQPLRNIPVESLLECAAEKGLLNTKGWKQHGK